MTDHGVASRAPIATATAASSITGSKRNHDDIENGGGLSGLQGGFNQICH